jgi:hypothetical protein
MNMQARNQLLISLIFNIETMKRLAVLVTQTMPDDAMAAINRLFTHGNVEAIAMPI